MRQWLVTMRKTIGLTQQEVAKRSFIHRGFYSQIENGHRNPSVEVANSIATTLNFHPSKFFTERFSDSFSTVLDQTPITLALFDLELKYTWIFNPPHDGLDMNIILGKTDAELSSDLGMLKLMSIKTDVITNRGAINDRIEVVLPICEEKRIYDIFCNPLYDKHGQIIGGSGISIEVISK